MAAALLLIQRKIEYKKGEILMLRIQQYVKAQSLEDAVSHRHFAVYRTRSEYGQESRVII